jgi:ubiquinone/menaquinone biosynthesis C-methylase UbiE
MTDDVVVQAVRERFDGRAPTYDDSAMHRDLAEAVADFVDLAGVGTLLDVATGTGLVLRAIDARARDAVGAGTATSATSATSGTPATAASVPAPKTALRLIGVDVSPGMLAVARRALPTSPGVVAELVEADARRLPLPDGSVDLITCVTGLHLIPDTSAVLAEWVRVLRPGGRVVTATFAEFDPGQHHRERTTTAPAPYPLRHDPFRTPEALGRTVAEVGLRVGRRTRWTDGHDTLLIAELTVGAEVAAGAASGTGGHVTA